jgi:glycosyltransferase involved in cell wall biosynthesis
MSSKDHDGMTEQRIRVLFVGTHPVQYTGPIFRLMAQDPRLDILLAYCSLQGAESQFDPGFGIDVKWDIPLLEGYPWALVPNRSIIPRGGSFFSTFNPGVWQLISDGRFDAVVILTGYLCATFWIAMAAAKRSRIPVLFGTDAHELAPRDHKDWKLWVKRWLWPRLFGLADVVLAPSSGTVALMRSLGIPKDRIALTPYCVDNDWWTEQSAKVDRTAVRARWRVSDDAVAVLFCAKLQPWKRPQDLLRAFAQVADHNAYLIFAGEGPLRSALESEAHSLGINDRIRFLGFVNQSGLPEIYTASDIFVLPSEHEPFGVVVNEAMLCHCPVIISDRVGAGFDLVRETGTGFIYPSGNVDALATILSVALADRGKLKEMSRAAVMRMETWSWREHLEGTVRALEQACARARE